MATSPASETDPATAATADGLTISGQRSAIEGSPRYLRMERGQGRFTRTFVFGGPVVSRDIQASFEHGILSIRVTKSSPAQERRIAIS